MGQVHAQARRGAARAEDNRQDGRRNGCFDHLYRGHIAYLDRAKSHGDVLVVAVNDDASIRRLKGPRRPRRPPDSLEDMVQVLAALSCVDVVVPLSVPRAPAFPSPILPSTATSTCPLDRGKS
jgi:D-beta-D-heptose 7-phosphate kinase / D-beta-D-heptose 1-phosphate adenosyltransferase